MRIIYIILHELYIPVIIYLYPGIAFLSNLINFCLLMYEPNWFREKGKKILWRYKYLYKLWWFFFVVHASKKVAIIVEKYLPNVCSDLSFHNHINYQRNPVVFIHVVISHIHSSLFVSWFLLENLIILKLWIYTVRSEILWHRQHILRMYLSLKENPTYTVVKSWHVCAWVTITY